MRQEVQVTLTITFDANADLSKEDIIVEMKDKNKLVYILNNPPCILDLHYMEHKINVVKEEAEIYGNK